MRYNSLGKLVKDEDDLWNEVHALRDENRKLRCESLMWKAKFFKEANAYYLLKHSDSHKHLIKYSKQLVRIAEAMEERARKLKDNL